jgi:hypothetical protein
LTVTETKERERDKGELHYIQKLSQNAQITNCKNTIKHKEKLRETLHYDF